MRRSILGLACLVVVAACGGTVESPGGDPAPGPSATATATATTPPSSSAKPPPPDGTVTPPPPTPTSDPPPPLPKGACNAVVDDGPVATSKMVAANAPAPTGGVIVDGKYHLVEIALFTGAGGTSGPLGLTVTTTFVIKGNVAEAAAHSQAGPIDATDTFATNGTSISFTEICPSPGKSGTVSNYSANGAELTVYTKNNGNQIAASRYVRVP